MIVCADRSIRLSVPSRCLPAVARHPFIRFQPLPAIRCPSSAYPFPSVYPLPSVAARHHGDRLAEAHTHVDGIAGHFAIGATKSGIEAAADCRYLAVFEAKLYSPLASGTRHAAGYDQVSRTVACVINTLLRAGSPGPCAAHVVVLYPADNPSIDPARYTRSYLEGRIAARVQEFGLPPSAPFACGWRAALATVRVSFVTWETALAETGDDALKTFYELCQRFNR